MQIRISLFKKECSAFTLAEVLIVLTIIGIVATLTIPALMKNTQDQEFKSALKKEIAAVQVVFQKIQSENGGPYLCTYKDGSMVNGSFTECPNFWNDMKSNLNVVKVCNGSAISNCLPAKGVLKQDGTEMAGGCPGYNVSGQNNSNVFVLNDGATIFNYYRDSSYEGYFPIFAIDVNGKKPPNQWNKDVYSFFINNDKFDYDKCGGSGTGSRDVMMGL